MAALISKEKLSEFHRMLTTRPHMAGTPCGRAVAEQIAETLRSFGLSAELKEYQVYLSHPERARVTVIRGQQRRNINVFERSDPRDPDTRHPELPPAFIAYSASGKVRGPVVYVNYGLPGDYDALAAAGVTVRGAIVLARYGRVHRAVKVRTAESRGARGIVIYSDPADDGFAQGEAWPGGMWRAAWFVQRGNAKYSWFWHGDPLTPGAAAMQGAARLNPDDAPTLPKIPAIAISWAAAQPILEQLGGPAVPRGFQGALPFTYHAGPGPAEVELEIRMNNSVQPIFNVIARIEGREEPDREIILGTHHDAWTFGGVDPGSSGAAILEVARVLGELRRTGWQPRRSIVLAFWDAEEYGLIGSTEHAEQFAAELRLRAVAYINSDLYLAGRLKAGGAASLRDFVADLARSMNDADGKNLYAAWREEAWRALSLAEKRRRAADFEVELEPLGSGADFVPFQTHLGLPALSLELSPPGGYGNYGSYHSNYDTRQFMEKFGDPGWRHGPVLAELLSRAVMRLAAAELLPFRFSHAAEKLQQYVRLLEVANVGENGRPRLADVKLAAVHARLAEFARSAQRFDAVAQSAAGDAHSAEKLRASNDAAMQVERSFAAAGEGAREQKRWYRHAVYGWNIYALYAGQTLPALHRAIQDGDAQAFSAEASRLERALQQAVQNLDRAREALE